MNLGAKIKYLRQMEGALRGMDREMTQQEVVSAIRKELRRSISQSYLSQIESGARQHLTNASRNLLASFFKVHPGYLVDDPEGYHTELISDVRAAEEHLDRWLLDGAEMFRADPELGRALGEVARHKDSRKLFILLAAIGETPGLADRLLQVLRGTTHELDRLLPDLFHRGIYLELVIRAGRVLPSPPSRSAPRAHGSRSRRTRGA